MIKFTLKNLGYNPTKTYYFIIGLPFYVKTFFELKRQKGDNKDFYFDFPYPILDQRFSKAGVMSGYYFFHDLLVAQKIFKNNPIKHVDIGSRIDGFVTHVASFRKIEVFDIRQQKSTIENIEFTQADLMILPKHLENYCDSVSSLNAIEHFGLGRYGDKIDYLGHIKAIDNIYKMLTSGGKFYFAVPIGESRIVFNAHRIFSVEYLIKLFSDRFNIDEFSYVDDQGNLHYNVEINKEIAKNYRGFHYGCCIFELSKK